jgi:hypothetical protein
MSSERDYVLAYGLVLTHDECLQGLANLNLPENDDPDEAPDEALAEALGLTAQRFGDAYDDEEIVIGPSLVYDDAEAVVRCDKEGLGRLLEAKARGVFPPGKSRRWVRAWHVY